jgi:drug/metabolite transporter (DMT)-like permease
MEASARDRSGARLTLAAFLVTVLLGGLNFVAVRYSNRELPPFWGAGLRIGAAALLLLAVASLQRVPFPRGRALLGAAIYGLLGFGGSYALGYWAMLSIPAGLAAIVLASAPLFTFIFAVAHRLERFQWRGLVGALLAIAGIAVTSLRALSGAVLFWPLLAALGMAVCFAEASIIIKRFPQSHPISTNVVAMAVGAVVLLVLSSLRGEVGILPMRTSTWVAVLYLVVLGTSALFVLFLFVLRRWSASAIAYQFVLFPLVAVAASALLEGTPITTPLLLGGGLILGGVYVGVVAPGAPPQPHPRMGSEPCGSCPT